MSLYAIRAAGSDCYLGHDETDEPGVRPYGPLDSAAKFTTPGDAGPILDRPGGGAPLELVPIPPEYLDPATGQYVGGPGTDRSASLDATFGKVREAVAAGMKAAKAKSPRPRKRR